MKIKEFDRLCQLGLESPEKFAIRRRSLIKKMIICNSENKEGLMRLQSDIDSQIAICGSPIVALKTISQLINDNLEAVSILLRRLDDEINNI